MTEQDPAFAPISKSVFQRFIQLKPEKTLDYIDFLLHHDLLEDALLIYYNLVKSPQPQIKKSTKDLTLELAEFVSKFPERASHLPSEDFLFESIEKFPEESAKFWVYLADFYTRLGEFDHAREVFDSSLDKCDSVASFGILYSAYLKFEETIADAQQDYDRLESLIDKRPFLLSNVVLRHSPNNVNEWLNRIELCQGEVESSLATYTEAIKTIDVQKAVGKVSKLWLSFASFYEQYQEIENANVVFHKATQQDFKSVDELSLVYCEWAEMHVRHDNLESAREILEHAVGDRKSKLANNVRAWSFLIDLLQSIDDYEGSKRAYERMIEVKIATPLTILNYTSMLQQANQFEESFRVFEKAVQLFPWPNSYELWLTYLTTFIQVMGGSKLERVRYLFRECIAKCPQEKKEIFFLIFADYEENFGLLSHAMDIYEQASKELNKISLWNLYLAKVIQYYGVVRSRQIY